MNDTAVQETNTDCKPKLHKNDQLVFKSRLLKSGSASAFIHLTCPS